MQRLWMSVRLVLLAMVFPLLVCSCGKEEPKKLGESPPGHIGQNDPRWKGIPEETGDARGIYSKKTWVKPNKTQKAP
jgi:hypothetical protein